MDDSQADHGDETMAIDDGAANAAVPTIAQLEEQLAAVNALTEQVQAENAKLEKKIAALEAKLAKAKTGAKTAPAQGRKVDPSLAPAEGVDDEGNAVAPGMVLLGKIGAAESVELVALGAKHREIAGLTFAISGGASAFRFTGNGLRLALPQGLEATAPGAGPSHVHAWGLILDGKPAAYGARFEPLVLNAGQRTNLSDDVIF